MQIKVVRKILDKESIGKSDEEIKQIISIAYAFADLVIERAEERHFGKIINNEKK